MLALGGGRGLHPGGWSVKAGVTISDAERWWDGGGVEETQKSWKRWCNLQMKMNMKANQLNGKKEDNPLPLTPLPLLHCAQHWYPVLPCYLPSTVLHKSVFFWGGVMSLSFPARHLFTPAAVSTAPLECNLQWIAFQLLVAQQMPGI